MSHTGRLSQARHDAAVGTSKPIRVMVEQGKTNAMATAFDWRLRQRSARSEVTPSRSSPPTDSATQDG